VNSESTIGTTARPLRIVVAGGGTGGHVSPGIAVLDELRTRVAIDPLWIGSRKGYEFEAAGRLGIPFKSIQVGKLRRYPSLQTVIDAGRIPIGIAQAWRHLRAFQPDVLFATGGYVSTPVAIAASRLSIPSISHEQTAYIGLATKLNARFVDMIALSYDRSRDALGPTRASVVVTGNPVRSTVLTGDPRAALDRFGFCPTFPLVYVTGGALGSRAINAAVADALPDLLQEVQILHQCGPRAEHNDIDRLTARAKELPDNLRSRYAVVERTGNEIGDIFAAASLVIGRAGAGTIAELASVGLPSILIPLPGAEEQRQNALYLAEAGASILIAQADLTPAHLTTLVTELIASPDRLTTMRAAAKSTAAHEPAQRLVDEILRLTGIFRAPN
jgi:UDP-N-acetylglucosamine--N-acetylmuramyl-(pentapeptide) pyrophosphoryl-undecaprenol N-acetylglucosamine transferase